MGRKPYRVEMVSDRNRTRYFLVKDVRLANKKSKVRVYLRSGSIAPAQDEIERYRKTHGYILELEAAKRVGKIGSENFITRYLPAESVNTLEEVRYLNKISLDLLTKSELEAYEQQFEINYVSGTTQIEGNTLTLQETANLLLHGIIPKSKSYQLREINEIQNFNRVKQFRETYRGQINIRFIKRLHQIILSGIDDESAGVFRRADNVVIAGCDHQVCPSIEIEEELQKTINYYYKQIKGRNHPFEEAVMFHYFFEIIHPFTDGNGRVGREILNYMLSKSGYPKLLFLGANRTQYIEALKLGDEEKFKEMVTAFADIIIKQRLDLLKENLKKLMETESPIKPGQTRIEDFWEI